MEKGALDYLEHFGLEREPFGNDPLPGFHFETPERAMAERRVLRGPLHGKGLTVLTGGYGSGKTTLLHRLLDQLPPNRFDAGVLVLSGRNHEPVPFLQRVAKLFGVTAPSDERSTLLGQLAGRLLQIQERGLRAVAVIDEAQLLEDESVLEELRGLLNLEGERGRALSVVLSGLPALENHLAAVPALGRRVDVKVRLEPFDAATTARYLAERLAFARGKPDILHPAAAAAVHDFSGGSPRAVNTLADNALFEAFLAGRGAIVVEDVERAAQALRFSDAMGASDGIETLEPVVAAEVIATPV